MQGQLAPGEFLLVVFGHVTPRLNETVETDQGALHIMHCPYELVVLDGAMPAGKRQIISVGGVGKGFFLDDLAEATRRARAEAAAEAAQRLTAELQRKLSSAD
jgi:hypothetical protein